jgi:ribulose 1,5-bisphosphate synthetase/thiazole synthase
MSADALRVAIVGGGIGGLAAANVLSQHGIDVSVYEQAERLAEVGAGLGQLFRKTDKREQAREHLSTATTMFREMCMTYWLHRAEAERELAG